MKGKYLRPKNRNKSFGKKWGYHIFKRDIKEHDKIPNYNIKTKADFKQNYILCNKKGLTGLYEMSDWGKRRDYILRWE